MENTDKLWADLLAQDEAERKVMKERSKKLKKLGKQNGRPKKSKKPKDLENKRRLNGLNVNYSDGQESKAQRDVASQPVSSLPLDSNAEKVSTHKHAKPKSQQPFATTTDGEKVIELGEGGFDLSPEQPAKNKQTPTNLKNQKHQSAPISRTKEKKKQSTAPFDKNVDASVSKQEEAKRYAENISNDQAPSKQISQGMRENPPVSEADSKEEELQKFLLEADSEAAMEKAGERFQYIMAAGEMRGCERRLNELLQKNEIDLAFVKLLELNIYAAKQHGWANKQKVFMYLFEKIQKHLEKKMKNDNEDSPSKNEEGVGVLPPQPSAQVHAPRMLPSQSEQQAAEKTAQSFSKFYVNCEGLSHLLDWGKMADKRDRKNKQKRRRVNQQIKEKVNSLAASLKERKWAVADRFASPELIDRVRKEIETMRGHFENSEIWWGKDAEIGAQITVPSVRGDQVLWMCGGHQKDLSQYDSTGEQPKMKGSIEPCDPEIKGKASLKRFTALRDLLRELDRLVIDYLAEAVGKEKMGLVRERTDCMLAEYKDGARFQRHVDNTSGDGRRLTVLCYLTDPDGWDEANGGALRLDGSELTEGCPIDIAPQPGRLAMFFAHQTAHEVLPSYAHRLALTVWYYDVIERTDAVERAKREQEQNPSSHRVDQGDIAGRQEASNFMKLIVDDTDLAVADLLHLLREKKEELRPSAKRILAGITGLPSPEAFSNAIEELTIDGLEMMREEFRKMGV